MFSNEELKVGLKEFAELYEKRPVMNNFGGGHSPHYYYLWWLIKKLGATQVIESGIWKGQSTWLIEQCESVDLIISIDIDLSLREYISKNVAYESEDFNESIKAASGDVLVFFDDHVDHIERIQQCREKGIKHMIFDDNYPHGDHPRLDKERAHLKGKTMKQIGDIEGVTVFEFPPVFYDQSTRWGDAWSQYPTKPALMTHKDYLAANHLHIYWGERREYTWICYVKLD